MVELTQVAVRSMESSVLMYRGGHEIHLSDTIRKIRIPSDKSKWRVTHQSYTPFDSVLLCLYLCVSFDLLKVSILHLVVRIGLCLLTALSLLVSARLCTSVGIHLLTGCLHDGVQVVDGSIDSRDITTLMSILQLLESLLNRSLLVRSSSQPD